MLLPHTGVALADLGLYSAMVLAGSFLLVFVIKRATGAYSRYVIGC